MQGPDTLACAIAEEQIVIVEGISDKLAIEALVRRIGRDLDAERITVVPIGGAQAIRRFLVDLGPRRTEVRLAGLYDAGQETEFRNAFWQLNLGASQTRADLEGLGFFACEEDLEDELIRAVGPVRVQEILEAHGDLRSFRTLQQQPAQRGRTTQQQLRRFMGAHAGHKAKYARILVDELDLDRVPRPLKGLLDYLFGRRHAEPSFDGP